MKTNTCHELTDAEFAFGIYDCDGSGKIDAYDIPDVLRSLNLNPTIELCEKMGATKKRGEKKLTVEEFLPIFGQVSFFHDVMYGSPLLTRFSFSAGQSSKGPRIL
jgi:Ca2+-binding EF-hand superfamily protein